MPKPEKRDAELAALLDEVRTLKQDLEVLKRNPVLGEAVAAALAHAREIAGGARGLPPDYAVLVRPGPDRGAVVDLPPDYAVLVRPGPDRGAIVDPAPLRAAKKQPVAARKQPAAARKQPAAAKKPAAGAGRKRGR